MFFEAVRIVWSELPETPNGALKGRILLRSSPLGWAYIGACSKQTPNHLVSGEILQREQHKIIIYLNACTVILNKVNKP